MDFVNVMVAGGIIFVIGAILGLFLAVANKYFSVKEDNRVETIEFILPSYNCGACGYVSCEEMAKAILDGKVDCVNACKVIGKDSADKLREYCKTIKNNNGESIDLK